MTVQIHANATAEISQLITPSELSWESALELLFHCARETLK